MKGFPSCLPRAHTRAPENEQHPMNVQMHGLSRTKTVEVLDRNPSHGYQGPTNNFFGKWPDGVRGHIIAMLAEFIGTTTFLFFSFAAAQVANEKEDTLSATPDSGPSLLQISFISSAFGMSLAVNVWIFYRVSGGMFNPAVSLGLWVAGAFNWIRLICVVPCQFLGGIAAAGLVSAMLPNSLQASTTLSDSTSVGQGFFIEAMITGELVMTIIMLAVVKSRTSFMAPLAIGVSLFIGHLIAINFTGAAMNPARALGPPVLARSFPGYFWIYLAGPFVGGLGAAGLYHLLKAMAYWTANPGQDHDGLEFYQVVSEPSVPKDESPPMSHYQRRSSDLEGLHNTASNDRMISRTSSFYV